MSYGKSGDDIKVTEIDIDSLDIDALEDLLKRTKSPKKKIPSGGGGKGSVKTPMATLVKQFNEIDKRTRCEEDDNDKGDKKLRVYEPMKGFTISSLDAIKKMSKMSGDPKEEMPINGRTIMIAMAQIIEELVGVIEKLPDNVMSYDDKAKVMKYKDVRIHKPLTEKAKDKIKKKKEREEKNEFLDALDGL